MARSLYADRVGVANQAAIEAAAAQEAWTREYFGG
jgi:hypothetical protein